MREILYKKFSDRWQKHQIASFFWDIQINCYKGKPIMKSIIFTIIFFAGACVAFPNPDSTDWTKMDKPCGQIDEIVANLKQISNPLSTLRATLGSYSEKI